MNMENDVILAVLKLSRAMRRCAPPPPPPGCRPGFPGRPDHPGRPMHGSAGRLLACVAENPNVSSRDLCELLDVRPSSLSEMLARAERDGWIVRTVDEEDRRVQRVNLSEKGRAFIEEMQAAREKELRRKTACFTEEEKAQFCALCNRLSDHLESLALEMPRCPERPEAPADPENPDRPAAAPRRPFPPEGKLRC